MNFGDQNRTKIVKTFSVIWWCRRGARTPDPVITNDARRMMRGRAAHGKLQALPQAGTFSQTDDDPGVVPRVTRAISQSERESRLTGRRLGRRAITPLCSRTQAVHRRRVTRTVTFKPK